MENVPSQWNVDRKTKHFHTSLLFLRYWAHSTPIYTKHIWIVSQYILFTYPIDSLKTRSAWTAKLCIVPESHGVFHVAHSLPINRFSLIARFPRAAYNFLIGKVEVVPSGRSLDQLFESANRTADGVCFSSASDFHVDLSEDILDRRLRGEFYIAFFFLMAAFFSLRNRCDSIGS